MKTCTTKEAAEELGLTTGHVRLLLEEGKIRGKKFGRDWMVLSLDYQRKRKPKRKKEGRSHEGKCAGVQRLPEGHISQKKS